MCNTTLLTDSSDSILLRTIEALINRVWAVIHVKLHEKEVNLHCKILHVTDLHVCFCEIVSFK